MLCILIKIKYSGTVPIDVGGDDNTVVIVRPTLPESTVTFNIAIKQIREIDINNSIH